MKKRWTMYWAFVAVAVISQFALGQPLPGWSDQFATGDLNDGEVRCMAVFDEDGPGPALPKLFAGGSFRTAGVGGPWVRAIARWDGMRWTDVGGSASSSFGGIDYGINAMVVFDEDGPGPEPEALYVGGYSFDLGGVLGAYKWDGNTWTSVTRQRTGNLSGPVNDFAVFDEDGDGPELPKLFAAGRVSVGNESWQSAVARWDGIRWAPVGAVFSSSGQANSIAVFDADGLGPIAPSLYIGGTFRFSEFDTTFVTCAKWDGQSWSHVTEGMSGDIRDLAVFDPDGDYPGQGHLFAAGSLSVPDRFFSADLLRWDGNLWSSFEMSVDSGARHLSVADIDGEGPLPNSLISDSYAWETSGTALWNGVSWTVYQNDFYWNSVWPTSFGVFDDDREGGRSPTFFIGGGFWSGSDGVRGLTQLNGQDVVGIGNGVWRGIHAIRMIDFDGLGPEKPKLCAVGNFVAAGNSMARSLAIWDGESWEAIGGLNELIDFYAVERFALCELGTESSLLIAGGLFHHIMGEPSANIAAWDGSRWRPLAESMTHRDGFGTRVYHLLSFDDDNGLRPASLYVAGYFTSIDGVPCEGLARWDGLNWHPVGDGLDGENGVDISSMAIWDIDSGEQTESLLLVAGSFDKAGGSPASGIAAWDGVSWSSLGDAVSGQIDSVALVPDEVTMGITSVPYISGSITFADGRIFQGIMRLENGTWSLIGGRKLSGNEWLPVGGLSSAGARSMKNFDEDGPGESPASLFIVGWADFEGDSRSYSMAKWDGHGWSPVGNFAGNNPFPRSLEIFDEDGDGQNPPGLFVGGRFNSVDGIQSVGIARWGLRVPYIARQPANLQRGVGESALFNVKAGGGDALSFQWRRSGSDLIDDDRHSGASTETLRISNLRLADRGQYDVVITNEAGLKLSNAARLDVSCHSARITPDLNRDQSIDGHDIQALVDAILIDDSDAGLCIADVNGDGMLDIADAAVLVARLVRP